MNAREAFTTQADRFSAWLFEAAAPLWLNVAYDEENGGFVEALDHNGAPLLKEDRRVRVQFRQIYFFDRLFEHTADARARQLAQAGFADVRAKAYPSGETRGCVHMISAGGGVIDAKRDLYDQAFALLACASRWRTDRDPEALALAENTVAFIESNLASPHGGWLEDDAGRSPRRQNPHMHLFEAFLALHDATEDENYLKSARKIFDLFTNFFFDEKDKVLREFFDSDWSLDADRGNTIEPGHMMEWVWLLQKLANVAMIDVTSFQDDLFQQAIARGEDTQGFLLDAVSIGAPSDEGPRRLWPQTERVKAICARIDRHGDAALSQGAQTINAMLATYLNHTKRGLWIDSFDAKGAPSAPNAPASILYHLIDAVRETEIARQKLSI